jgi:hypothetical protein
MLFDVFADTIAKSIRTMVGLGIWERPIENHKIKMPFGVRDDGIANNSSYLQVLALFVASTTQHTTNTPHSYDTRYVLVEVR